MSSALAVLLFAAGPSFAEDPPAEPASTEIKNLLDSIPAIETQKAAEAEAEPPPPESKTFPEYAAEVRAVVLAGWAPSAGVLKDHPKAECQVLLRISEEGQPINYVVVEASGVKKFDKSVDKAIEVLGDLPAPPLAFIAEAENGLIVTFSAKEAARR